MLLKVGEVGNIEPISYSNLSTFVLEQENSRFQALGVAHSPSFGKKDPSLG